MVRKIVGILLAYFIMFNLYGGQDISKQRIQFIKDKLSQINQENSEYRSLSLAFIDDELTKVQDQSTPYNNNYTDNDLMKVEKYLKGIRDLFTLESQSPSFFDSVWNWITKATPYIVMALTVIGVLLAGTSLFADDKEDKNKKSINNKQIQFDLKTYNPEFKSFDDWEKAKGQKNRHQYLFHYAHVELFYAKKSPKDPKKIQVYVLVAYGANMKPEGYIQNKLVKKNKVTVTLTSFIHRDNILVYGSVGKPIYKNFLLGEFDHKQEVYYRVQYYDESEDRERHSNIKIPLVDKVGWIYLKSEEDLSAYDHGYREKHYWAPYMYKKTSKKNLWMTIGGLGLNLRDSSKSVLPLMFDRKDLPIMSYNSKNKTYELIKKGCYYLSLKSSKKKNLDDLKFSYHTKACGSSGMPLDIRGSATSIVNPKVKVKSLMYDLK